MTDDEIRAFIVGHTAPRPVPIVPELSLYQADEMTPLWRATAAQLERTDPAPFWAFPWTGGQAVARYVLDEPAVVRGRAVLDFGTGSGLVAIAAARAGAARVLACDIDPFCAVAVRLNAELNGVGDTVAFHLGDPSAGDGLLFEGEAPMVLLGGDLFYEKALADRTLAWFGAMAARGARALVGDPGRVYSPDEKGDARLRPLRSYRVPTSPELESATSLVGTVLEVLPVVANDGERAS